MFIYDLMQDLHDPASPENHLDMVAAWALCVVRFKKRNTFDRTKLASGDQDGSVVAAELQPLVIVEDCISMMTSKTKESMSGSLVATLKADVNYAAEIAPGDWILGWMTRTPEKIDQIVGRVGRGEPVNGFHDCLKFLGRVSSIRKQMNTSADGHKTVTYALQAISFQEFSSQVYWDPALQVSESAIFTYQGRLGILVENIVAEGGIDINKIIPELIETLYGRGIPPQGSNPAGFRETQIVTGHTSGTGEAPFSFVVPETVGKLLGIKSRSKTSGVLAYADLLQRLIGRQKYDSEGTADQAPQTLLASKLQPRLQPMEGLFVVAVPQFSGRTIWSVLNDYLNPPLNEIYTTLRVDGAGSILPTVVVRQLPFSTTLYKTFKTIQGTFVLSEEEQTFFTELPRWRLPPPALLSYDIGRSDSLRFNFIHLTAQTTAQTLPNSIGWQLANTPPIRDVQDIQRNGMRADMLTAMTNLKDSRLGVQKWMILRADISMSQQLMLNGTVNSYLIEEPICEGDNFEMDETLFHIENIVHTGSVTSDGHRRAMTTLQLSYGVRTAPLFQESVEKPVDGGLVIFSETQPTDLTASDPGFSSDKKK